MEFFSSMNFMNFGLNHFFFLLLIRYSSIYHKKSDIVIKIYGQEQVVTTLVPLLRRSNLYLSQMLHEIHFSSCNHFVPRLWPVQVVKCFCEKPPRVTTLSWEIPLDSRENEKVLRNRRIKDCWVVPDGLSKN